MSEPTPGTRVTGRVTQITSYGAYVDVGDHLGLILLHEMTWGARIKNVGDHFAVGDDVQAVVVRTHPDLPYVVLGTRQLRRDPWADAGTRYPVGSEVPGRVVSNPDYGVFVAIEEEMEGLLHVSQLAGAERPGVGELVMVRILSFDIEERRLLLGVPSR